MGEITLPGILVGFVIGSLLTGFFTPLGNDIYNWFKNKSISIFGKSTFSDKNLKEKILSLYKNIIEFLKERSNNEPQTDFNNFKESTNRHIKYFRETMNLYDKKFGSEIIFIRQEFLKRNIKSNRLNSFYEHPTNPLGIREIALGLVELASKLDVNIGHN